MSKNYKGKTACCIELLQILNTGRTYNIAELAEILEVNPRNIPEYIKELREVSIGSKGGFYIETIPGRYGGYRLNGNAIIPALNLTQEDKYALVEQYNYLMAKKDFINKNGCTKTMGKIFSSLLIDKKNSKNVIVRDKVNSFVKESIIQQNYDMIATAINTKTAVAMTYNWLKEPSSTVIVDPYQLFLYDNEWRFFGWIEDNDKIDDPICYFKLSRVENIKLLDKKFRIYENYKFEDYVKKNVFAQNGEMFEVKLIAVGVRAKLLKEKQYGYNQKFVECSNGTVEITCEMQKNPSTYNSILGFGDLVEVKEPQWLKEKIKELAFSIYKKY